MDEISATVRGVKDFLDRLCLENKWFVDWFRSGLDGVEHAFLSSYQTVHHEANSCEEVCSSIVDKSQQILDHFLAKGEVYRHGEDLGSGAGYFQQIQPTLLAYLTFLRTACKDTPTLLARDSDGVPDLRGVTVPYLADPRGGTFTHDASVRREYFRVRAATVMSLWDMSLRAKKKRVMQEREAI